MTYVLMTVPVGVIVGIPIILFAMLRLEERPGPLGWLLLAVGMTGVFAPTVVAFTVQQTTVPMGRYLGR